VSLVIDCSLTMAWAFADEADETADAVLERVGERGAVVPALWPLEVANVLLTAERRGRLTGADSALFLDLLSRLPIAIDEQTASRAFLQTFHLGRELALSAYDAAYLELAARLDLPLATRDARLAEAARRLGVKLPA